MSPPELLLSKKKRGRIKNKDEDRIHPEQEKLNTQGTLYMTSRNQ